MTETFRTEDGNVLTVETAELGAELWPQVTGRHGGITGTLAVLRSHKDGRPDAACAFIREPHAHGWAIVTEEFPADEAAGWRAYERAGHPRLGRWLDEVTGGAWFVNTPLHPTLHTHRYQGQSLQHDHPQGDQPHGYFGHREDSGTAHVTGKVDG